MDFCQTWQKSISLDFKVVKIENLFLRDKGIEIKSPKLERLVDTHNNDTEY